MVAKKTAVQQSASGRSMGAAGDTGAASAETVPTKTASTKKTPTKKASTKKAPTKKTSTKTVAARTASAGTVAAKTASGPTASSERTTASKEMAASAKKAVGGAAPAKTAGTRPVSAKAGKAAGKVADKSAAPVKRAPRKAAAAKGTGTARKAVASAADGAAAQAAETTGATTVVAKKTSGTAAADKPTAVPKARVAAAEPGELAVRPGEDPWTPEEAAEAREELLSEALRLRAEITHSEESLAGLMRDSGDGAGDDQADTGTKNITRESEMALAANAREMLEQTERALERLDAGTYGLCENCGNAIGKARMQAFPRATLCVECKQKQERRY